MGGQWSLSPSGRTQTLGALTASSSGTAVTSSASANTKGSWADIGGTLDFAAEYLEVYVDCTGAGQVLFDIGINVGGNRYVIAEDLVYRGTAGTESPGTFTLPIHVPAGAQLSARALSSIASTACQVVIVACQTSMNGAPGGSRVMRLTDIATNQGVAVDPGGTANTKARTQLVASTPIKANGLYIVMGPNNDTNRAVAATALFDIEMGAAASEEVLLSNLFTSWGDNLDFRENSRKFGWFWKEVPSGIRMSCNAQCSINTAGDRTFDLIVYGLIK